MDEQLFWDLIETTRLEADGRMPEQTEALHAALSARTPEEVAAFDALLTEANHSLYTWALWGAAELMLGDVRDDSFTDVRSWVVSHGRGLVDAVTRHPDALADTDDDLTDDVLEPAREWADTADAVHTGMTGFPLHDAEPDRAVRHEPEDPPYGTQLSDEADDLARVFPRLAQRYR